MTNYTIKEMFLSHIYSLQDEICSALEKEDGKGKFIEDLWEKEDGGGGGKTRIIKNGNIIEKGGVNVSAVNGVLPKMMMEKLGTKNSNFFACGLSLVIHPLNPFVPTTHANWRFFELYDDNGKIIEQWFGGGMDLTPYYLFEEDAVLWHKESKKVCDKHHSEYYPKFKKWCDEYFWNTHRKEARGVGGLFFDRLQGNNDFTIEDRMNFTMDSGKIFAPTYLEIVKKRKDYSFTEEQKNWQEIRRGRYVEFNLIHDKGTLFGLKTGGRIESILMSLPAMVRWEYNHHPEENTEEEKLLKVLMQPKEWV